MTGFGDTPHKTHLGNRVPDDRGLAYGLLAVWVGFPVALIMAALVYLMFFYTY